jgi:hypothetical protein
MVLPTFPDCTPIQASRRLAMGLHLSKINLYGT